MATAAPRRKRRSQSAGGVVRPAPEPVAPRPERTVPPAQDLLPEAPEGFRPEPRPTRQQIRERAYLHYLSRSGGSSGDAVADWLQAERELRAEMADTGANG